MVNMLTILIVMMVSWTYTHVNPIKLYTLYICSLLNVNISVKLFLKSIEYIQSLTIISFLPCFHTFFARELNM